MLRDQNILGIYSTRFTFLLKFIWLSLLDTSLICQPKCTPMCQQTVHTLLLFHKILSNYQKPVICSYGNVRTMQLNPGTPLPNTNFPAPQCSTLLWVQYAYLHLPAAQATTCQAQCLHLAQRHYITSEGGWTLTALILLDIPFLLIMRIDTGFIF